MNDFSEINDPNIYIQDGPLACYCSHVRGMIYGHLNFEDYTIIIEDDAFISNTENIEKLEELRLRGLLTEEEFTIQKMKISRL
jgi:hypothetical protein